MIIHANQSYEILKKSIISIYESKYSEDEDIDSYLPKLTDSMTPLTPLTPLTRPYGSRTESLNHEHLISFEHENSFISSVSYIRKSFTDIIKHINKIDTREWMNDEIVYDISEFYTPNGLKKSSRRLTQKDIVMNAFSKTNLRYMCIKAEIIIYVYYLIESNPKMKESIKNELEIFIGGLLYAVSVSNDMKDNINTSARFIWELSTLFNIFVSSNKIQSLPHHHVFDKERKLLYENVFGQYEESNDTEHDAEHEQVITEYVENYKNIIQVVQILINQKEVSLCKLLTTLSDITKPENKYITTGIVIN